MEILLGGIMGYFFARFLLRKYLKINKEYRELRWEHGMCQQNKRDLLECIEKNKALKDAAEEYNRGLIAKIKAYGRENQALMKENKTLLDALDYLNFILNKKEMEKAAKLLRQKSAIEEILNGGKSIFFLPRRAEEFSAKMQTSPPPPKKLIEFFYREN